MVRTRTKSPRFSLSHRQHELITTTANQLRPDQRHSFVLRVERCLAVSATGSVTDPLVSRAIDKALREVAL
ncbi:hypothetical protein V1272_002812 [Bradyrhizobium sp. AZCC 1708]